MTDTMTEEALFESLTLECRVCSDGSVRYYNTLGQMHRVHGPAVKYVDGAQVWYQNDLLHRLDGPAVEHPDGFRSWWQNGLRHRIDGYAVERPDGRHEWHINGKPLYEAEWRQQVASMEHV